MTKARSVSVKHTHIHKHTSPSIWRGGWKEYHVFDGDSLLFYSRHFHSARVNIFEGAGTKTGVGRGMWAVIGWAVIGWERERELRRANERKMETGTDAWSGTGWETRGRTQDGNGDGNEDGIGKGGGETKKRKKPHKSCRRDVENGGDLGGKRKKT